MFCTECGQSIADDAKFCAYCGTRRTVPAAGAAASTPPPVSSPEPPVAVPPTARPVRSTAEIMPIRMQRPAVPQPRVTEATPVELEPDESVVPWPAEEAAPHPLFAQQPAIAPERPPARPATPPPPTYSAVPPAATDAPGVERYRSVPFADTQVMPETTSGKRKMSPVLIGAILVALIALAGIVWMVRSTMGGGSKAAAAVGITIYPTAAKVVAGKSADFAATVTGAPTSEVTWKVEEGDDAGNIQTRGAYSKGDEISLYCTYTAPKTPGTYHLVATSTADASRSATAEITVTAK